MYFFKKSQKKFKTDKEIKIFFEEKINMSLINFFLKESPKLSSGRKNYKNKEINNVKNICLLKVYKKAKKMKAKYISNIIYKKKRDKIIITALLNL
tara:strand:- start:208 stop:495 length:288 start_codon:yes stop_codon:yes gene_type:complete